MVGADVLAVSSDGVNQNPSIGTGRGRFIDPNFTQMAAAQSQNQITDGKSTDALTPPPTPPTVPSGTGILHFPTLGNSPSRPVHVPTHFFKILLLREANPLNS